jgi:hypothetical protein
MGFWNPRAICPSCGGKIRTQASGLLTGMRCQHCGVTLTGRVGMMTNTAKLAPQTQGSEQAYAESRQPSEQIAGREERRENMRRWYAIAPEEEKPSIETDLLRELVLEGHDLTRDDVRRWLEGGSLWSDSDLAEGWYPDPDRPGATRYWDGKSFSKFRTPPPSPS